MTHCWTKLADGHHPAGAWLEPTMCGLRRVVPAKELGAAIRSQQDLSSVLGFTAQFETKPILGLRL